MIESFAIEPKKESLAGNILSVLELSGGSANISFVKKCIEKTYGISKNKEIPQEFLEEFQLQIRGAIWELVYLKKIVIVDNYLLEILSDQEKE